jgi:hypothetical protein
LFKQFWQQKPMVSPFSLIANNEGSIGLPGFKGQSMFTGLLNLGVLGWVSAVGVG